jgi:hypothetical protein
MNKRKEIHTLRKHWRQVDRHLDREIHINKFTDKEFDGQKNWESWKRERQKYRQLERQIDTKINTWDKSSGKTLIILVWQTKNRLIDKHSEKRVRQIKVRQMIIFEQKKTDEVTFKERWTDRQLVNKHWIRLTNL